MKNDKCNVITNEVDVVETCCKYFDELLNVQTFITSCEYTYLPAEPIVDEVEVSTAICKLGNNKTPKRKRNFDICFLSVYQTWNEEQIHGKIVP